jgi:hypothetical protein
MIVYDSGLSSLLNMFKKAKDKDRTANASSLGLRSGTRNCLGATPCQGAARYGWYLISL